MLFKRSKPDKKTYRYPGEHRAVDGHSAVMAVEEHACDTVVVQAGAGADTAPQEPARRRYARVRDAAAAAARATGASAAGLRACAVVDSLASIHDALHAAAGKQLTTVYHLTCRAVARHTGALQGGHDDYFAASDAGLFQMFARGAQQAADFALIARAVAERALLPGLVAQDVYRTSHSVQETALPEPALVDEYLGRPGDIIDCPTPAQAVLFGDRRRRVPALLDPDHPAGIGGIQDTESYFKALAAQRTYFASHVAGILSSEFERFAGLTGRRYAEVSGYRVDDAEVVLVAQGSVIDELEYAVDLLRERDGIKAGVVDFAVFRPFPGAALARLLRGKRAVAVLERTDRPLSHTLPLTAEVRAAIDRALENGAAGEPVHAEYDAWRSTDRPRVVTGVYGAGAELPSFTDLAAMIRNLASTSPRPFVHVGLRDDATIRRFPHLHSLQQALAQDYPSRAESSLPAAGDGAPALEESSARLYSLSVQGGIFAANLFARSLAEDAGAAVRTVPQGGLEASAHTATVTLLHSDDGAVSGHRPDVVDTALVTGGKLVEDVSSRDDVAEGGTLIVETGDTPAHWWRKLSRRTGRWIHDRKLHVIHVDAARIAEETASKPSSMDQLAIWALLGAYAGRRMPDDRMDRLVNGLRERLAGVFGEGHYLIGDIVGAFQRGAAGAVDVDCSAFATEDLPAASDGEAPWTVKDAGGWNATVFDPARFWHSVGYLYDSGQADRALSDPYLATGIIPARSSAFRDMTPYRLRVPVWLAENCTGCGECWSKCPDSALPPTVQAVTSLLSTAMNRAERSGPGLVQLRRFADHLATQAYKLLAGDGLHQYLRAGALFGDAFERLVDKLGLDEEKQAALRGEFDRVRGHLEYLPVARTDLFFNDPHAASKGSGMALSIAVNPLACTGCGVCVDVCPDDALDWAPQTPELMASYRDAWNFEMELPRVDARDIDRFVEADGTDVHRLLDREAYHSLVGGDGSFPGNAAKTAVRLVAAAVECAMRPRFEAHVQRLGGLIEKLEAKIQGDVAGVLKINDFEDFSRRLDRVTGDRLTPDALASALGEGEPALDPERLRRLTALLDRLREQKRLYESGAEGHGRAPLVMVVDGEKTRLWAGTYPYNPLPYPWLCHVPGAGVEAALGVSDGIARQVAAEAAVCRAADLELDDAFDPAKHREDLDPSALEPAERSLIPPVFVLGEAGTTSLEAAADLAAAGRAVGALLIDSTGTPAGEDGAVTPEAYLLSIARDHAPATAVQSSVGAPGHLLRAILNAVESGGPVVARVYAPDPQLSGIAPEKTAAQAALAVDSRAFPLFVASADRVSIDGNPAADAAWEIRELVFAEASGKESRVALPLTPADWAINEARFQGHFRVVPRGEAGGGTVPLADYIARPAGERGDVEPVIHFEGDRRRHLMAVVSEEMASWAAARAAVWTWLRSIAAPALPRAAADRAPEQKPEAAQAAAPAAAPVPAAAGASASAHEALTQRLLQLSGFSADPDFFKKSLREFVVERNLGGAASGEDDSQG